MQVYASFQLGKDQRSRHSAMEHNGATKRLLFLIKRLVVCLVALIGVQYSVYMLDAGATIHNGIDCFDSTTTRSLWSITIHVPVRFFSFPLGYFLP